MFSRADLEYFTDELCPHSYRRVSQVALSLTLRTALYMICIRQQNNVRSETMQESSIFLAPFPPTVTSCPKAA